MSEQTIPQGFLPYCTDDTFNDAIAPLHIKIENDLPILAMLAEKKHCNYVGMVHGGCLMTFMDMALSGAVCHKLGKYTSTPTINISFDFMAAAKEGDWIEARLLSIALKRTMGFVNATIEVGDQSIARASATFKLPDDLDAYPGLSAQEYIAWRTSVK